MKKNRGLTMVEVMVTVAVMGILAGIIGITMGVIFGQRVKSMAADTKSVFQSTQIASMGRENAFIELQQIGEDAYVTAYLADYSSETDKKGKKINGAEARKVTMTYTINGVDQGSPTDPVRIYFNRQTGGLSATGPAVDSITFSNGQRTITIRISRLTGKVTY